MYSVNEILEGFFLICLTVLFFWPAFQTQSSPVFLFLLNSSFISSIAFLISLSSLLVSLNILVITTLSSLGFHLVTLIAFYRSYTLLGFRGVTRVISLLALVFINYIYFSEVFAIVK